MSNVQLSLIVNHLVIIAVMVCPISIYYYVKIVILFNEFIDKLKEKRKVKVKERRK